MTRNTQVAVKRQSASSSSLRCVESEIVIVTVTKSRQSLRRNRRRRIVAVMFAMVAIIC